MKRQIIHFSEMLLGITSLCAGAAMGIIAGLGQTTSTGTSCALAGALGIKVGDGMILLYGFFLLLQLLVLGKNFKPAAFMQIIPVVLQGVILNFFKYDFVPFQLLHPQTYPQRFAVFFAGMVLISWGFTCTKTSKFTNYPPEAFCALMCGRAKVRFGTGKIVLDFCYVSASLLLCFFFDLDRGIVREGTLIFALCNGVLINFFTPYAERLFAFAERKLLPQ